MATKVKEKRVRKTEIPPIVKVVGERISKIMKEKKIKPIELSHRMEVETPNLRKYIAGTQEMKLSTLDKFADALECEVGDLFPLKHNTKKESSNNVIQ